MFSDVGPMELVTLAVLAVLLFGPDRLPEIIQNAAGFVRKVREISDSAKEEIRSDLGQEFPQLKDFEYEDLRPETFVRKHVLSDDGLGLGETRAALDPRPDLEDIAAAVRGTPRNAPGGTGSHPPFDPDAT